MKKRLTIIGIIVSLLLMVGVLVNFIGRGCGQRFSQEQNAKDELYRFAKRLDWDVKVVICEGTDFDNDGFISCSVRVFDHSYSRTVEKHLQCASGSSIIPTHGCRLVQARVNNNQH